MIMVNQESITCCHKGCGISFAVPSWWHQRRREDHTWWYCPNGHQQHFEADSEEEKLRRERDLLKQNEARLEDELRIARIMTAETIERAKKAERATKRLTKRAAAGSCPCCQRTFANMSQHMKRQHPEFVRETGAKVVPIALAKATAR